MELTNEDEPFKLTEAFDGVNTANAVLYLVHDGIPRFHVETITEGQAAWTYDIFFVGPHLANVPELVILDEGTQIFPQNMKRYRSVSICIGRYRFLNGP